MLTGYRSMVNNGNVSVPRARSLLPREEVKLLDRCYSDKAPMTSQPAGKGTCLAFAVSHKNRWERKAEP